MKKKAIKYTAVTLAALALIILAALMIQPTANYHVFLHQNIFEWEAYEDDNTAADIPFEVMLSDFHKKAKEGQDSVYVASIFLQPRGNKDSQAIVNMELEPNQTEHYMHYDLYIEEFAYNETEGKLQVFLKVEQRRYQKLFAKKNK